MCRRHRTGPLAVIALLVTIGAPAAKAQKVVPEATRSRITIVDVDGTRPRVVLESSRRFNSPDWTPDGTHLIVNGAGALWRVPVAGPGGEPEAVPIGSPSPIDMNHAVSPDGKWIAFTARSVWKVPIKGGDPIVLMETPGSYVHGWSPDGKWVACASFLGRELELTTIPADGGVGRRLTGHAALDDAPHYSADGRWIYFRSNRAGTFDIWRMPANGPSPGDVRAERVTRDERDDAEPRPSPDGKWLIYTSFPPRAGLNPREGELLIRRIPLPGPRPAPSNPKPDDLTRIVGGRMSLGAQPFSPDGRRFAFASFETPQPTVRVVLFTPSDRQPPDIANHRLTQYADAAERFLVSEMTERGYPPAATRIFRRAADGSVEVTFVKGDRPAADPYYSKGSCEAEARMKAAQQLQISPQGHVWWVFLYLGERPVRFSDWRGGGDPRDGGGAIVDFDTLPGEVQPELGLEVGFNARIFLKALIHELVHAFGVFHIGPDPKLGRGNSLMGPNNPIYAARGYPNADMVYLTKATAAMLWKHPIFSGTIKDLRRQPSVRLADYTPSFDRANDQIILTGRLDADMPAHSVVVLDDLGRPEDRYWYRSHAGRVADDGSFRVVIDRPVRTQGQFRILFCFDNGAVTGDGKSHGEAGAILKAYRFRGGLCEFGK